MKKANVRENLSLLTVFIVRISSNVAAFFKCIPFELESTEEGKFRVRPFQQRWKMFLWKGVTYIVGLYTLYQVIGVAINLKVHGLTQSSAAHTLYCVLVAYSEVMFLVVYQAPRHYAYLINQTDFILQFSAGATKQSWYNNTFSMLSLIYFYAFLFLLVMPMRLVLFILKPNSYMYLYAVVSPMVGDGGGIGLLLVMLVVEFVISVWSLSILHVFYSYWCANVLQTLNTLDVMFRSLKSKKSWFKLRSHAIETSDEEAPTISDIIAPSDRHVEELKQIVGVYRSVQVLNTWHNTINQEFSATFTLLTVIAATAFIFISLTGFNSLSIYVYMLFPVQSTYLLALIVVLYPYLSLWEIQSGELIQMMKRREAGFRTMEMVVLEKRVTSLVRIRNKVSFFFHTNVDVSNMAVETICNYVLLLLTL